MRSDQIDPSSIRSSPLKRLVPAPLKRAAKEAHPPLAEMPKEFQLVTCDGPPGSTAGGHYGLLPVMGERLPAEAVILLDDTSGRARSKSLRRWTNELRVSSPDENKFAVITRE